MKKLLLSLLILLILLVGGIVLAKDVILKTIVEQAVTRLTGFETHIDRLKLAFPSTLHVEGLKIHNPSGFSQPVFAHVQELYVALEIPELLRRERIHLREIKLNLQEINIEKNQKGVSNVTLLSSVGGRGKKEKRPRTPAKEDRKAMPFLLDRLELTMRRVSYLDQSGILPTGALPPKVAPGPVLPSKVSVDMRVEKEVFTGITDPKALVNLILVKIAYGTTFGRFMGIDADRLFKNTMKDTLASGEKFLEETKGLARTTLSDTTETTKRQITSLFGKIRSELEPQEEAPPP